MSISWLFTTLSLISIINAGQVDLILQAGVCNVFEKQPLLNVAQIAQAHLEPESCGHTHIKAASKPSWTRKPQCLVDRNTNDTFCVYTSENFASGRGISFFTTPSIAKKVTKLPAFTELGVHNHANNFNNPPWEVRNVLGRGNGLFATRTLYRGDLILADTPVGVYNSDALYMDYQMGYKFLRKTYDQLPEDSKKILMRTAAHNRGDPIMERINTNAFAGEFEGASHFLLYPETALMNHDCRPNAMYYHNTSTLVHSAHASRTIHAGEEITITYINLLQPIHERQDTLKMIWGFDCSCSLCSSGAAAAKRSDHNIQKIIDLHTKLADWSASSSATPSIAEDLLELYQTEHLHAAIGTGHLFAAYAYNAVGDTAMAVKHAKKALKAGMVSSGSAGDDEVQMRNLVGWPKAHWSFMARSRVG